VSDLQRSPYRMIRGVDEQLAEMKKAALV